MHKTPMRDNFFEGMYSIASSKLSPFFLKTPLTPNQVTIISGFFGVFGAYLLILDSYVYLIVSAIFIQLYTILDLVDGDIAREKEMQSNFGMWLDIFFDKLIDFLLILFLSIGVFIKTNDSSFLIYGILLMGLVFSIQFIMVLNDTYFKKSRRQSHEFKSNHLKLNKTKLIFSIVLFFRKHLSMQHTTFTFLVSVIAMMDALEEGLVFLTFYSLLSLFVSVVINFYQIK